MEECPVCLNVWDIPNHIPLLIECGHHVCKDCWSKIRSTTHVDKPCPICRRVCIDTCMDMDIELNTACGLTCTLSKILGFHTTECDSCWSVFAEDVDVCMRKSNLVDAERWMRMGKFPSQDVVVFIVGEDMHEAVRLWLANNTTATVTFSMIMYAARQDSDRVLELLVPWCTISTGCDLSYLYRLGKFEVLVQLWCRGARDNRLIECVVMCDDDEVLRRIYNPECIVPSKVVFTTKCLNALLEMGHRFDTATLRMYLNSDTISVDTVTKLLDSGAFEPLGLHSTTFSTLGVEVFKHGYISAAVWFHGHGVVFEQDVVDSVYATSPPNIHTLLEANITPSHSVLSRMTPETLRVAYTYQCSECDTLTPFKCEDCNHTRFCSPECRQKGTRHTPFCVKSEILPDTEVDVHKLFPECLSCMQIDKMRTEMFM